MLNFTTDDFKNSSMKQIYNTISICIFASVLLLSCNKEGNYPIPNLPVNLVLNLNLPAYQDLNNPGGWAYVNGGSRGIIVYNNFNEFVALDRHTTVFPDSTCSVAEVDSINTFVLNDPCSAAQFSITNGTALKEPAKWGLRQYFATWDGASIVQITN